MCVWNAFLRTMILAGIISSVFPTVAVRAADSEIAKPFFKPPVLPAPAVDGINAKFDASGGSVGGESVYGSRGAISFPLAAQWGFQIDGAVGSRENRVFGGIAGHLF